MGALDGIRVIDAGIIVQGPQAGQTMVDMGADVIKVEMPGLGDQARWIPISANDSRAPYFIANNRGKRSITLDLRLPDGAEAFLRLIETADVVISNFKAGTLDEWGVGYEDAAARNPRIIYGMGTTFGPEGPAAAREGADLAGQAAGGLISTTGMDDGDPSPVGAVIADHIGAQNMTIGILAAIVAREQTGRGQRIDVSLFGSQLYAQNAEYTSYFLTGKAPGRANRGHPLLPAVYGLVETADGWLALVGVPPQQRDGFYAAIGRSELLEDQRFQPFILDPQDRKELFTELTKTFRTRTTAEWGDALTAAGCRWAPVNDYAAATADPHSMINGYMQDIDHPEYGKVKMMGSPIRMSDTPVVPGRISPELGADTELLLVELGYDWDQITNMRESRSI
jgi:CoA:oxalate CoA-transferase